MWSSSPPPPLSRSTLVVGLYTGMGLAAVVVGAARGNPDVYRVGEPAGWLLASAPVVGALVGLAVVALTRLAIAHLQWARDLERSFRDLLGPLSGSEIVVLAAASALGEELLFRGALMPWLGLWAQAAIFALLHVGPSRRFLPWTVSAFAIGALFGELATETGSLGAPIVAHFTINFLNLRYVSRARRR